MRRLTRLLLDDGGKIAGREIEEVGIELNIAVLLTIALQVGNELMEEHVAAGEALLLELMVDHKGIDDFQTEGIGQLSHNGLHEGTVLGSALGEEGNEVVDATVSDGAERGVGVETDEDGGERVGGRLEGFENELEIGRAKYGFEVGGTKNQIGLGEGWEDVDVALANIVEMVIHPQRDRALLA